MQVDKIQFHLIDSHGKPTGVFDFRIFEYIKNNYPMFVCGCPYIYDHGVFEPDHQGTKLKKIIRECLFDQFKKSRTINQVYNLIVDADELQKDIAKANQYPKSWVNFQDCMVDSKSMNQIEHSPQFLSINQVPWKWEDVKKSPEGTEIERFFSFIFNCTEDKEMLLEYAGLCLTKDTSQQKFLILCGLGGTGKSLLISLIEKAAGVSNVSNISLQELSRRFSTSLLVGKTLNSCADLSVEALEDTATMKKLLGEDFIFGEQKGKNGFMFKNYAKMLFSTNTLPLVTSERTNGFFRRLLILKMDRQPENPDPNLMERLEKELPYFVQLAILALHEMYQRGTITESENSRQAVAQMRRDSDVVESWLAERCTVKAELKVERTLAFDDFKEFCEAEERTALTRNSFFKALRTKNFSEVRGKTERYFCGFSVGKVTTDNQKSDDFMTVTQEQLKYVPFD